MKKTGLLAELLTGPSTRLLTKRLIIFTGDSLQTEEARRILEKFKACSCINTISDEHVDTVYYYNKNALYFDNSYNVIWDKYDPVHILLSSGNSDFSSDILSTENLIKDFPKMMELHNIDTGDHKTEDSSTVTSDPDHSCLLCDILNHNTAKIKYVPHIVYKTAHFVVMTALGRFYRKGGYFMIVPIKHITSIACLEPEVFEEFLVVYNVFKSILETTYNTRVFGFEAGSEQDGAGKHKTSIVHAHFHLVTVDMPLLKEVKKGGITPALINKRDLVNYRDGKYLLFVDHDDNWFIANDPHCYYPRQFCRQIIAEWLGCHKIYNWRIYPFPKRMTADANTFRSFCKEHFNSLPKWVQNSIRFND